MYKFLKPIKRLVREPKKFTQRAWKDWTEVGDRELSRGLETDGAKGFGYRGQF